MDKLDELGKSTSNSSIIDVEDVTGEMDKPASTSHSSISSLFSPTDALSSPVVGNWLMQMRQNIRPWSLFLNTHSFSKPASVKAISSRILANLGHFQSNYIIIFLLLTAYCLITSPLLLLVIVGSIYGGRKVLQRHEQTKFRLLGRDLTTKEIYAGITLCTLPLLYVVGVGAVVFWALGASVCVIGAHALFYNNENNNADDNFGLVESI